jgi:UDP-perosamine 4-acetyltransferase
MEPVMNGMPLILIGGGGHAGVVLEVCRAAGVPVAGFVDDDPGCPLAAAADAPAWLGRCDGFAMPAGTGYLIAIGGLAARRRVLAGLDPALAAGAVVHPAAWVSPTARLGDGVVVMAGAVINRQAAIGDHAIVNTRAVIEHDCVVGANTHLAPGSALAGGVAVGADTLIGMQASVLPGVVVGAGCRVGAGAVVTRDVPDGVTVVGAPARAVSVLNA